jgi:hypothetical protein
MNNIKLGYIIFWLTIIYTIIVIIINYESKLISIEGIPIFIGLFFWWFFWIKGIKNKE